MNNLNSIILEGNLTRDPELTNTPKGTPVCNFSLASNRFFKQDEEKKKEVSFFNVEAWARTAENCGEYLEKGRGVRVVGRLKQDRWLSKDGSNRERVKIVAEHVEFKPQFKRDDGEGGEEPELKPAIEENAEGDDQELLEAV